jgi:hypothetical protein
VQVRSIAELGGLGADEGPPVAFALGAPNVVGPLLPWVFVAMLLCLKPNRCARAWWIGLPLLVVLVTQTLLSVIEGLPSGVVGFFGEPAAALTFGVAAVWLLAPWLVRTHRFLTFLCILLALGISSGLALSLQHEWSAEAGMMMLQKMTVLGFGVLGLALGLFVAGLICRRHFGFKRLLFALPVSLLAVWFVISAPFFGLAVITMGADAPWLEYVAFLVGATGVAFGILLPFVVLSAANRMFGERLKGMLHVTPPTPPTLAMPPPPMESVPAQSL